MPKRTGKRLDVVQNSHRVGEESIRRFEESQRPNSLMISQVMAEMGRRGGKIGGKNRMENLGAKGRSALGKAAVEARWAKYRAAKKARKESLVLSLFGYSLFSCYTKAAVV
jgi:hypothetical protein